MPSELDPQPAIRIVGSAISSLNPSGNKVLCTRRALHEVLLAVAQEAHDIGSLAGQQERERNCPEGRPAWMDIADSITPPWPAAPPSQTRRAQIAARRRILLHGRTSLDTGTTTQRPPLRRHQDSPKDRSDHPTMREERHRARRSSDRTQFPLRVQSALHRAALSMTPNAQNDGL